MLYVCHETGEDLDSDCFGCIHLLIRDASQNRMAISETGAYLSSRLIRRKFTRRTTSEKLEEIEGDLLYVIKNTFGCNFGTTSDAGGLYLPERFARKHLPKSVQFLEEEAARTTRIKYKSDPPLYRGDFKPGKKVIVPYNSWREYVDEKAAKKAGWAADFYRKLRAQPDSRR